MDKLPKKLNFRLNRQYDDQRLIAEYLEENMKKRGGVTDAIIKAIHSYLTALHIRLDRASPKDRVIIEKLEAMDESLWARWIKDMVYERLTGLDARTGEPIPQQVKVIETEKVVIQERLRVVPMSGNNEAPEAIEETSDDLNQQAYTDVNKVEW